MAVTLREVAERAGVSRSAVSRTFTEGASVSPATRARVMEAAEALGYSPNALASSLTTGRTKLIGLVVSNFHNPIFLEVIDQFTRELQALGLRPLIVNMSNARDPQEAVRLLRQYSVDAAIVASSTLPPEFAQAFQRVGIPTVHTFGRAHEGSGVHVVGIDNIACGAMAAETLIARGYDDLGVIGGPEGSTSTEDRLAGFLGRMAQSPEIAVRSSHAGAYSFDAGRVEMARQLLIGPAQAYFCADDVLTIGALSAVREAGLDVPRDIGLIGLNDMEMARWQIVDLTTVHQPIERIVRASIERVVTLLQQPDLPAEALLMDCHVVERGTLRPLPGQPPRKPA